MRHTRTLSKAIAVLTAASLTPLRADNTPQALPFAQNWTNTGLITTNDNWAGVAGIIGYRGDDLTTATGTDPQTILADGTATPVNVIANQTNPNTLATGGVAEFDTLANPTIALNGSGTADAPFILLHLNTTGKTGIRVQYNVRDLDASVDNAIQPVALQYRVGASGNFTNLPAGFVADGTSGPSLATLVTPVSVLLPAAADNQALVEVRIITTNAVGNDEWVGIDDISVTAGLALTPSTLPNGAVGTPYSQVLTIQNNLGQNCTFGSTGTLPDGITLTGPTATTVTLSGTPTAGGPFNFHMTADCGTAGTLDQVYSINITGGAPTITKIHDVQGSGLTSPLSGSVTVEGIVVGDFQGGNGLQGFFVQEEDADADNNPATSEGIFVFDGSSPTVDVSVGDKVQVTGTISEFNSSGVTLTELVTPTVSVVSTANSLPTITTLTFPATSATDFERFEGMRAQILQPMTVTDSFTHGDFGELVLSAAGRRFQPTHLVAPGAGALAQQTANDLMRIVLDDGSGLSRQNFLTWLYPESGGLAANNTARTGETIDQTITGILDNRFGTYRIQQNSTLNFFTTTQNPRTVAPGAVGTRIRVGAANVLNFFTTLDIPGNTCGPTNIPCRGANSAAEFTRQRDKIIAALNALDAHVVGITELENNATASLQSIIDGLNAINPGKWAFVNTGVVGTDAIKPGFIYQPAVVTPIGSPAVLTNAVDIKAIDTRNRPAIAQTFRPVSGNRTDLQYFTVSVNHFKSKGGGCGSVNNPGEIVDPLVNDGQADCNLTRTSMATALINWLATNPTNDPTPLAADRKVLIVGDLNSYAMEDPISAMTSTTFTKPPLIPAGNPNATYTNVMKTFFGNEAYSYVFDGQTGYLDYGLSNKKLTPLVTGASEWHINADEPIAIDYNVEWIGTTLKTVAQQASLYAPNAYRASDHDPLLVGINPLCGDLDDDGDVDLVDQALMQAAIGQTASPTNRRTNFDGDASITLNDYRQWLGCYRAYTTPPQQ